VALQFYRILAGGSRELPSAIASPRIELLRPLRAHLKNHGSWHMLGSSREPPVYPEGFRWLPTDRTAEFKSGSPPGPRDEPPVSDGIYYPSPGQKVAITKPNCTPKEWQEIANLLVIPLGVLGLITDFRRESESGRIYWRRDNDSKRLPDRWRRDRGGECM
jgi:hypothetical protein